MKSLINELFFDKELINNIKKNKLNADQLYNQLVNGKITLKEYLHLI